jgi:hypothetical protein
LDPDFITRVGEATFVLKLKNLGFNEEFKLTALECRTKVALIGIWGHAKELNRDRQLGTVLLYTGNPFIHEYTYYVGIAYSAPDDVRKREPKLIYSDDTVRLYRAGVGVMDYFFAYRNRMPMHDRIGKSDGAAYQKILDIWKL